MCGQGCLEQGQRGDITHGQLIYAAVGVQVVVLAEPLGRQHAVMMIHGVVGKLAQGHNRAFLMKGADDQIGIHAFDTGGVY